MNSEKNSKGRKTIANYSELGKLVAKTMMDKGISRKTLGDRLDITSLAISSIFLGNSKPSLTTLYRMHEALGLDLEDLFAAIQKDGDKTSA